MPLNKYKEIIIVGVICIIFYFFSQPQHINVWDTGKKLQLPKISKFESIGEKVITRDPFKILSIQYRKEGEEEESAFHYRDVFFEGTITGGKVDLAVINGELYQEGDMVDDIQIIEIRASEVVLGFEGETRTEQLPSLDQTNWPEGFTDTNWETEIPE